MCSLGTNHTRNECAFFTKLKGQQGLKNEAILSCITLLRGLSLKQAQPQMWARIMLLMDQSAQDLQYRDMIQEDAIDFLVKKCNLDLDPQEIIQILGIIRTNALKIQGPDMKSTGRVVFPTLSYMSHSCICNAKYR